MQQLRCTIPDGPPAQRSHLNANLAPIYSQLSDICTRTYRYPEATLAAIHQKEERLKTAFFKQLSIPFIPTNTANEPSG